MMYEGLHFREGSYLAELIFFDSFFCQIKFHYPTVENILLHGLSSLGFQFFGVGRLVLLNNGKMNWIILPL
ncbi:hypothetical protein ACE6H2_007691 [Prunus campanulata]